MPYIGSLRNEPCMATQKTGKENEFMNTKIKMRMLSLLLCLVLVVGLMPTTAMAAEQEISAVVATSQDLDSIPQLYGLTKIPTFNITQGSPTNIMASEANLRWQKKIDGVWTNQEAGRFTSGEWRISTSLRLDNDEALQYDFAQNLTFEVNGKFWTVETPNNHQDYSFARVYSPVFTIDDDPNVQPPVPVGSVHVVLNGYAPGAAAASATVTTDANVDVEFVFLKLIDKSGDDIPDDAEPVTGNFASGEMYAVVMNIRAKSGYDISSLKFQNISLDRAVTIITGHYNINEDVLEGMWVLGDTKQYTVTFDSNGGTGTMADVTGISGVYTLPANGFTAPNGKQFKAWSVGGVEKAVGDKITVTANTTVTAVWKSIEYNITGTVTSFNDDSDDIMLHLIPEGFSEVAYETIVKGNTVDYYFADVATGTYTLKVMKENHIAREYKITVGSEPVILNAKISRLGDVNMDGKISILDAIMVQKAALTLMSLDDYRSELASVRGKSSLGVLDAILIQKYALGLIDKF